MEAEGSSGLPAEQSKKIAGVMEELSLPPGTSSGFFLDVRSEYELVLFSPFLLSFSFCVCDFLNTFLFLFFCLFVFCLFFPCVWFAFVRL